MDQTLLMEQALNGVQLGVMLFLMATGLTLTFGILNFINLTHWSFYMLGGYLGIAAYERTGSFIVSLLLGALGGLGIGLFVEFAAARRLYSRTHLDQVLGTFGVLLFFNEAVQIVWGRPPLYLPTPAFLEDAIEIIPGVFYPAYRFAITLAGLAIGAALYYLIRYTRTGMLIRAGASNREMTGALGVNVRLLFTGVFALGATLAAVAGILTAPIASVDASIGDSVLILTFVVVVIGGVGSIRGAFAGALLVGIADTFGRFLLVKWLGPGVGPAFAAMTIYIAMAGILVCRPTGLFAAND